LPWSGNFLVIQLFVLSIRKYKFFVFYLQVYQQKVTILVYIAYIMH